jgi:large repetitive protein
MKKYLTQKLLKGKLLLLFLFALGNIGLKAQTNVTGNQSGTWTKAKSPYIINGTVTVPAGQKLTIEAGVEVRSLKYDDILNVLGILKAIGTTTDSIRFNGFANPTYSAASTHGGLIFLNSSSATDSTVLAYVAIDRMGDKDYWTSDQAAVEIAGGKITIRNSAIRNSELRGIYGSNSLTANPIVSNVVFTNNAVSAYMYANNVGSFTNNVNFAVTLRGTYFANAAVNFPKPGTGSYYIMEPGGTYDFSGCKVTIQPGVEFRSMSYDNKFSVSDSGVLVARGTATDSIARCWRM